MQRHEGFPWFMPLLLLVVIMAGCGGSRGVTPDTSPTAIPDAFVTWVSSTSPANNATGVGINSKITVAFSKGIDASTITTTTFLVTGPGATPVLGTVACQLRYATFTPSSDLLRGTKFTATITTGVKDLMGNPLPSNFAWSFTTGQRRDTTSPTITSVEPADAATGVDANTRVTATFNEAMDPTTITEATFTLKQGSTPVSGRITNETSGGASTATFRAKSSLPNGTFTATVAAGVKDVAGNALASSFVWSFTVGGSDTTPPTVTSVIPANAAVGVSVRPKIIAAFSEPMAPRAMTTSQFALFQGPTRVLGTVTYTGGLIATFSPQSPLTPCTTYTGWIGGVKDLAGNLLASPKVWTFTTGLTPVSLRSAGSFAVLAGTTVTNTALLTYVKGNLGVSPGTAVTHFPPGIVDGTIYAGGPVAAQAQLDLTTAYLDAAGRNCSPVTVAGNIGGQTLTPGLYKSTSTLAISSGDLTLDAQGDANAVFIFQMASTLTTTTGRQVILSGGAQAANIYWQVGSSATLGTYSVFKGNILALASITLDTGATLDGRALAQNGAVTLDGNTITRP